MDAVGCPFVTAQRYLKQQLENKQQDVRHWQMYHLSAPPASASEDSKTLLLLFFNGSEEAF